MSKKITFVYARTKQVGNEGNSETQRQFGDVAGSIELDDEMIGYSAFCDGVRNRLLIPLDEKVKEKLSLNSERQRAVAALEKQKRRVAEERESELQAASDAALSQKDSAP